MSAAADKVLDLARGELGVKESPPGSGRVKYNDALGWGNNAWCCAFLWWLFREAGASELFFGGGKTAYCPALLAFHREQAVQGDYRPGDVVFFNFQGKSSAAHVGLCESWDGTYITTIDGNTGTGNEAAGGAVLRRKRHRKYIVGAYRPRYQEDDMTQEQFDAMLESWLSRRGALPASDWAREPLGRAKEAGITDATRPRSFATREEVAVMLANAEERGRT
ncbi:MAG: CHAP domain-containing protein [Lawsonibacter sp.]|nr:CHAP domain-containing protein [Lawsonibacter sp.]